ncbi:MAG: alkene reductase [Phycisphaeraceae bacterium]|nr:alkene reductase [Phycisphaeraceae bacterium]
MTNVLTDSLLAPLTLGDLRLSNRVVMAPLTRCRADDPAGARVPNAMMAEYYAQRSSAGMILSEATSIDPMGVGYPNTPGVWSEEQVAGWERVTGAVHERGGLILLQLWHVGRISDPVYLNGALPVAPSAVAAEGHVSHISPKKAFVTPRALEREEIPGVVASYRRAAENAERAGFDGVEIHGANGYLLDQFLQTSSNRREDEYGGPVENRARLMLEVTDACVGVWGAGRVGMHLAPRGDSHGVGDERPVETFGYVARELGKRGIAFICAREGLEPAGTRIGPELRRAFLGAHPDAARAGYIANERFTPGSAQRVIAAGEADAVAFGRLFIANPDLPARIERAARTGEEVLNTPNAETFYTAGPVGYVDYPSLAE